MISSSNHPGLRTTAALLHLDFQDLYLKYGASQPPRTGLHASSLLVSESEWCVRKYVLSDLYGDQAVTPELARWQWKQQDTFLHGWEVHRKWQYLFKQFGNVVFSKVNEDEYGDFDLEPELDLTHYDEDRQLYFSPDAILEVNGEHMVVEIKGINHDAFLALTDNLDQARKACETVDKAVIQCNLYLHLLQLNHGIILVENKNNQEFRVWVIEYNCVLALLLVQRAYQVKGAVLRAKHGEWPHRICASAEDSRACQCPLQGVCFREEGKDAL